MFIDKQGSELHPCGRGVTVHRRRGAKAWRGAAPMRAGGDGLALTWGLNPHWAAPMRAGGDDVIPPKKRSHNARC